MPGKNCRDHPFEITEHSSDNRRIRLSPANKEENISLRSTADGANLLLRALAVFILSVAGKLLQIGLPQSP